MSELPRGWARATLGEVCDKPQYGWTTKAVHDRSSGLKLLRTTDITHGVIDWSSVPYCLEEPPEPERYLVAPGDIVVTRTGTVGASLLVEHAEPAVFASYLIRFRPRQGMNGRYVAWFLRSPAYWDQVMESSAGIAVPNVNAKKLAAVQLPVAPAEEQSRIVAAIEEQFSRIDAGVESLERARRNLDRMWAAVLQAVVLGRLIDHEPDDEDVAGFIEKIAEEREAVARRPVPPVGALDIPARWALASLDATLADIQAGKSFKCEARPAKDDEWGVVKVSAMSWGRFLEQENKAVLKGRDVDRRHEIRKGNLLFSRANARPHVGATVIVDEVRSRLLLSDKSLRLVPLPSVSTAWINLVLRSPPVRAVLMQLASGVKSGMLNISQAKLRSVPIPLPPPQEQARILREVGRWQSVLSQMSQQLDVVGKRATALRRSVLARAFTGRLVSPDDELVKDDLVTEEVGA